MAVYNIGMIGQNLSLSEMY